MEKIVALVAPSPKSHRTAEETIALGYLAKILRLNGHKVVVIDAWLHDYDANQVIAEILKVGRPWLVGFSLYISNIDQGVEICKALKKLDHSLVTICGGFGPTFNDEIFLQSGFDVVVRGEAESVIVDLTSAMMARHDLKSVPGITYYDNSGVVRRNEFRRVVQELDDIEPPDRDEINQTMLKRNFVHVCSSRGCSGQCTFCSISAFSRLSDGKAWRGRSVSNIVHELRCLRDDFGVTHVKFVDDSFLDGERDEEWIEQFASSLKRLNLDLTFRTQIRADRLTWPIVSMLKEVGWLSTSIGIENGSAAALKRMGKKSTVSQNSQALNWLRDAGVYVQMGMILFDDQTTFSELEENLHFLKMHDWVVTKGVFSEMFAAKGTIFTNHITSVSSQGYMPTASNVKYLLENSDAQRAHKLLKSWHVSHSRVYDWAIDAITAPKVLPLKGYAEVYELCQRLHFHDLHYFEKVIGHINACNNPAIDEVWGNSAQADSSEFYSQSEKEIASIYQLYGLNYNGIPNPFLV